jgi:SAM-dependent methyltransferase
MSPSSPPPERFVWAAELLALRPTDHALEIGCGHGVALPLLHSQLPEGRLVALDRSGAALRSARRRCPRAELLELDLAQAAFEPASFDAILAVNVGSLHRDPQLLREVRAWLRPGGRLVLVQQPPSSTRTPTLATELQAALSGVLPMEALLQREIEGVRAVAWVGRAP